jgi:hypothetical protein
LHASIVLGVCVVDGAAYCIAFTDTLRVVCVGKGTSRTLDADAVRWDRRMDVTVRASPRTAALGTIVKRVTIGVTRKYAKAATGINVRIFYTAQ